MRKLSPGGEVLFHRLEAMFPDAWLAEQARATGLVKRLRSFSPAVMFWVLVLDVGVNLRVTLEGIRRGYNARADAALSQAAFYERFTPELVAFLDVCVTRGLAFLGDLGSRKLQGGLKRLQDLLILDSTVIRLHEKLATKWPATRGRGKKVAGVKLSCLLSVVADGPQRVTVHGERTSEIRTLHLGPWVKDRLLLMDLGFFSYNAFARIHENNGFFVSRLKKNANPLITRVLRDTIGPSVEVEGKHLLDVLPRLKREILDVEVEVAFDRRAYRGKKRKDTQRLRVVAVRNKETREYHVYITNLSVDEFTAEEIASLYAARWEVELLFRELKNEYSLDLIPTANPDAVKALLWTAILTLIVQRVRFMTLLESDPENAHTYSHQRSAITFREQGARMTLDTIFERRDIFNDVLDPITLEKSRALKPAPREHSRHIKSWRA